MTLTTSTVPGQPESDVMTNTPFFTVVSLLVSAAPSIDIGFPLQSDSTLGTVAATLSEPTTGGQMIEHPTDANGSRLVDI